MTKLALTNLSSEFLEDKPFFSLYFASDKDRIKILMDEGADPNIKNKIGKSPMDLAIELGEKEAIDLLKVKR